MTSGQIAVVQTKARTVLTDARFAELSAEAEAECANAQLSPVRPDLGLYEALEAAGSGLCYAVREGGELCGFAFVLLAPSAHNSTRYATVESLFVSAEQRRLGAGKMLMTTIEQAARERDCEAIFYSAHAGSRLARLLFLSAEGYTLTNYIYMRRLI